MEEVLNKLEESDNIIVDDDHSWGYQLRMVNEVGTGDGDKGYCGKLMVLTNTKPGSMHYHEVKRETFVVLSGEVCVVVAHYPELEEEIEDGPWESSHFLYPGDTLTLDPDTEHRMWAEVVPSVVLEVSTHDEDSDTYRV